MFHTPRYMFKHWNLSQIIFKTIGVVVKTRYVYYEKKCRRSINNLLSAVNDDDDEYWVSGVGCRDWLIIDNVKAVSFLNTSRLIYKKRTALTGNSKSKTIKCWNMKICILCLSALLDIQKDWLRFVLHFE